MSATEDIWCPICETSDMLNALYKYASDGEPYWECERCGTQFDYKVFSRIKEWKEKAEKWTQIEEEAEVGQHWSALMVDLGILRSKLEAAQTHIEDRLDFLKDATDYECDTLKIEIRKVLKILKGEKDRLRGDLEHSKNQAQTRYSWAKELEKENIELKEKADKLDAVTTIACQKNTRPRSAILRLGDLNRIRRILEGEK